MKNKYELIIIGTGPAGLTAGIYAARYKMNALIIGQTLGGLASIAHEICNFPTREKISGMKLMMEMIEHVRKLGVEIRNEEVIEIKKSKNRFEITTNKGKYFSKKTIIATGLERKRLELKGEKEFIGKGVNYCATCDAAFYKDKVVAVIGGGDAALGSAVLLSKMAKRVYIIYRQKKFLKAESARIEEVLGNSRIKPIFGSMVTKLIGKEKLEEIELNHKDRIKVDGIFVEVGNIPGTELAKKLKVKLEKNYIKVDKRQKTNIKGIFAAGDVTSNPLKQIITACAEGAIAADSAYKELSKDNIKIY